MADLQDDRPAPTLTIHRIYAKGERPRKEEIPKEYSLADLATDQVMVRKRLYGKQRFVKKDGLVPPSASYPKLWHNDIEAHDEDDSDDEEDEDDPFDYPLERTDRIYEERSVLVQSLENYQQLINHETFSKLLPSTPMQAANEARFGENLVVSGLEQTAICIGDVFEATATGVRLQVTSPRLPCAYVDKRNGSPFGMKGLKRFTMTKGLAGWFARVLQDGDLEDGMELVRVKHPHPKWNLEFTSKALYAEGDHRHMLMSWAQWARTKKELAELCALPALGWYEWKAEAQWLLDRWGRDDIVVKKPYHKDQIVVSQTVRPLIVSMPTETLECMMKSLQKFPRHAERAYSQFMALMIVGLAWLGVRALGWP